MPFQFTCPYCFKKTFVENKYAGQTGPCACCGKIVTLPELRSTGHNNNMSTRSVYIAPQSGLGGTLEQVDASVVPLAMMQPPPSAQPISTQFAASQPGLPGAFGPKATTAGTSKPPPVISQDNFNQLSTGRRWWIVGSISAVIVVCGVIIWQGLSYLGSSSIVRDVQARHHRTMCMNNASRIARALQAYAASHGTYPPPIVYDKSGKPMHSWRALILRELGELALYNRYKFDEPWDSESNSKLFVACPAVYISPAVGVSSTNSEANYFLLTGSETAFPGNADLRPQDIFDGLDRTIIVVEAANPIHQWSKPIDVASSGTGQIKMGGCHLGGITAAKADGTAVWIPDDAPPEVVKAFMTINGNESVDPNSFKP